MIRFGTAVREITPRYPVMLHGYSGRTRLSGDRETDVTNEPTFLGVLAIESDNEIVVFVTVDMIGVESARVQQLLSAIEQACGIGYPNVVISASHTHFAPAVHADAFADPRLGIVEPDERFVREIEQKVVEAVGESMTDMQEGTVEVCRTAVPSVLFNRRTRRPDGAVTTNFLYPDDPGDYRFSRVDDELTALRIKTQAGIKAVLLNYGCHPVTGGRDGECSHYQVSSDYPYYARKVIAEEYGCPVFFTLGAAGDAVPLNRLGNCRKQIGSVLGNAVLLGERRFRDAGTAGATFPIRATTRDISVDTIVKTATAGNIDEEYRRSARKLVELNMDASIDREAPSYQNAAGDHRVMLNRLMRHRLYPADTHSIRVQLIRVGTLVFVCLPFEVLAEFALRMKAAHPNAVLLSVTNGYQGYLPFSHEYERGGYEATADSTHFVPGTAERLFELVTSALSEL